MQVQIMVTNGGTHPPDKWAEITTSAIADLIQIDESSAAPVALQARNQKRKLIPALIEELTLHYSGCQSDQIAICKKQGAKITSQSIDVAADIEDGLSHVDNVMKGTLFAEHFKRPDVREVVGSIIGQHVTDIKHIERLHHAAPKKEGA